ncbi:MAG: hemopexin repeat-containing protein [Myxococcota bacterium]
MARFNALYILPSGSGEYHANRYRVYFRPNQQGMTVADLNNEFMRSFTSIFNGSVSGGTTNVAEVTRRGDLSWEGEAPLQFTLDAVFADAIDVPDVRDDWVGITWKEAGRGFAAQTLQLEQSTGRQVGVAVMGITLGGLLGGIPGAVLGTLVLDEADEELMLSHFLAGRRSWVIGDAYDDAAGEYLEEPPTAHGQVFYLETGAVERFSTWFYHVWPTATLAGLMAPGGDMRSAIDIVWKNLLENYLDFKGSSISVVPTSQINLTAPSPDWVPLGSEGVVHTWESFDGWRDVRNKAWTAEMLDLHPGLEMQFPRPVQAPVDAALCWSRGRTYFFKGSRYWRYDLNNDHTDWNYPKSISRHWPGLPDDLDAAIDWDNGKTYFFKGSQYWRWTKDEGLDSGYPKLIADEWPGIPNDIDAIFDHNDGRVYFFKGNQYWRWTKGSESADSGYPKLIADEWPSGLPSIDAGIRTGLHRVYAFAGDRYWRWDIDDELDSGYPKNIRDHW